MVPVEEKNTYRAATNRNEVMNTVSLNSQTRAHKHRRGLSDEQLAARLAQYAPLTDADFPNLSDADYANYARSNNGRITKGLEKWL